LITNAKILCPSFDIHKSKLVVVEWHFVNIDKNIQFFSFFSSKPSNNSRKRCFMEGKTSLGHKCILNCFNQILSRNYKKWWLLTIKSSHFSKNYFCYRSSFMKGSFVAKILDMELLEIYIYIYIYYISLLIRKVIHISKVYIYMFSQCNYTISCIIYD